MKIRSTLLGLMLGLGVLVIGSSAPDEAAAQCCAPPPPPCCAPPPPCCVPPPPPPPPQPPCCVPGHNVNIPGVNVFVAPQVIVNASASAKVSADARARGAADSFVFFGGGGGGSFFAPPAPTGVIQLNVDGGKRMKRVAYEATREVFKKIVIRAVCIDDRQVPHPASQIFPDRDIEDGYMGEIYRCLAGSHLQVTWAEWLDKADFEGGKTIVCKKGEALWYGDGKMECRKAKPQRNCFERSLLRRYGAGIKVLMWRYTETYTAYREEEESVTHSATSFSMDGGVGGIVY
jgi:hypothetical protein